MNHVPGHFGAVRGGVSGVVCTPMLFFDQRRTGISANSASSKAIRALTLRATKR
ncbi:MAG: hypothetical protein ACI9U2_001062 [Bradymonadia bacterium]|jgi:hypothetical protein